MAKKRKLSAETQNPDELEEIDEIEPESAGEGDNPSPAAAEDIPPPEEEFDGQGEIPNSDGNIVVENDGVILTVDTNGDDDDEPETVQKLTELLSKEQLVNLLSAAAEKYPDLIENINQAVNEDPGLRKIFVHGLGWETTVDNLSTFFSQYGEIEESNIVCDKTSGKSKGYGFILFKNRVGARRALKNPQKKIGNRMSACQMASAGPAIAPAPLQSEYTQRKIYVSNVSPDLDPQKLLVFFSKYGEIEEGPLGLDKHTGKPKGFALFVYKSPEGAKKSLEEPHKNFEGHMLHCQKAIDGPKPSKFGLLPHRGIHQGALPRTEAPNFTMGNLGHLMAPVNAVPPFKKPSSSVSSFSPGFGQNMAPLLANPGGNLGLPLAPLPINPGVRGIQGAYGSQPAVIPGTLNPGVMGSYGGHVAIHGSFGNPSMLHGSARGKHIIGPRAGVGQYMP